MCARPPGFDPNRVGALYAAIYWLLQPSDDPFGPEPFTVEDGFRPGWHVRETDFQPADEITAFATTIDEWRNFPGLIATVVTDALTACETVHAIMAQGEGVSASDDSHFEEFLAVLDAVEAGRVTVAPLPCSPFVQGQPRPADPRAVQLTHPHTTAWGELLNLVYTHVVGCIANALARPFGDANAGRVDRHRAHRDAPGTDPADATDREAADRRRAGHARRRDRRSGCCARTGPPTRLPSRSSTVTCWRQRTAPSRQSRPGRNMQATRRAAWPSTPSRKLQDRIRAAAALIPRSTPCRTPSSRRSVSHASATARPTSSSAPNGPIPSASSCYPTAPSARSSPPRTPSIA